nr:uncharacterized protein LOC109780913 [Aegilops tauschii subsp. strangulata]
MSGHGGSRTPQRSGSRRRNTPSPARRGRSPTRRGGRELVIHEWVVRDGGAGAIPMLTRTNYVEWSILMKVHLQAARLWEAVEMGDADHPDDRTALGVILRGVPPEMLRTLADTVKTLRMGVEHVCESRAQVLRRDFENLLQGGRDSGGLRASPHRPDQRSSGTWRQRRRDQGGEEVSAVVPPRYAQVAISIETLVDLKTLTIEEVASRFLAIEERLDPDTGGSGGKLLLTEEEWHERERRRQSGGGSSSGGSKGGKGKPKPKPPTGAGGGQPHGGAPKRKGNCRKCGKWGHWARECYGKPKQERREEANVAQVEEVEEPGLLMAVLMHRRRSQSQLRKPSSSTRKKWCPRTSAMALGTRTQGLAAI